MTYKLISFFNVDIFRLKSKNLLCCDATYRLNFLGYPVFVVGVASSTGKFKIGLVVLSSHEDHLAQLTIFNFVKGLGITPKFVMGKFSFLFNQA